MVSNLVYTFEFYTDSYMNSDFDFWYFLAGLGLFLFGMFQLETALKVLAGRSMKLFLQKQTDSILKSIFTGTIITAVLQSSSAVTLMLLAFVGAGLIGSRSAVGIVLGSNLGTTFTGWIVAIFGFKMDINEVVIPFIAVGTLVMIFAGERKKLSNLGRFLLGFGFLFMGLAYMKDSVAALSQSFDLSMFSSQSIFFFLLFGVVFTAVIQSSSITMVLVLSALSSKVLPLDAAFATIIGADLGTTVTVLLGSLKGSAPKKRVAMSHLFFNLITDTLAFILLYPFLYLIQNILNVQDPLFSTVLFHNLFNLMGIILFVPFIPALSGYLERMFTASIDRRSEFIHLVAPKVPDAALKALENEIRRMIRKILILNLKAFGLKRNKELEQVELPADMMLELIKEEGSFGSMYYKIKQLEGEIMDYYTDVQNQTLNKEESERLSQLMYSFLNASHAVKELKDVEINLQEFRDSVNPFIYSQFFKFHRQLAKLYGSLFELLGDIKTESRFEILSELFQGINTKYNKFHQKLMGKIAEEELSETEISTLMNVNKEIHSSNKAIIRAVKDLLLNAEQSKAFDELPSYH